MMAEVVEGTIEVGKGAGARREVVVITGAAPTA